MDDMSAPEGRIEADPLYRARPVGRSADGRSGADHDQVLYVR